MCLLLYILLITSLLSVFCIIKCLTSKFNNLEKTKCNSKACEIAYRDCAPSSSNWASTCDNLISEQKVKNCNVCKTCQNYRAEMQLACQYFGGPFLDATDECFLKPLSFDNKDKCNSNKTIDWINKNCKN